jgi:hypothetical protein
VLFALISFLFAQGVRAEEGARRSAEEHGVVATVKSPLGELPVIFENERLVAEAKLFLMSCAQQIVGWGAAPEVLDAAAHRTQTTGDLAAIKQIEAQWMTGESQALQQELTLSPCAVSLRRAMGAEPEKQYQHAFATDAHGAIVCMSDKTAHYWHGEDPGWVRAVNGGSGSVFVSRPRIDENVQQPLITIAVPIAREGQILGVLVVGKGVHNTKAGERHPSQKPVSP